MSLPNQEWLVKSSGHVMGPLSLDEVEQSLKNRQISVIDEIKGPMGRWGFIREHPDLKDIVLKIREEDLDLYEKTGVVSDSTRTITVESSITKDVDISEKSPVPTPESLVLGPMTSKAAQPFPWRTIFLSIFFVLSVAGVISFFVLQKMNDPANLLQEEEAWRIFDQRKSLGSYDDAWKLFERLEGRGLSVDRKKDLIPLAVITGQTSRAKKWIQELRGAGGADPEFLKLWSAQAWIREGVYLSAQEELKGLDGQKISSLKFVGANLEFLQGKYEEAQSNLARSNNAESLVLKMRAALRLPELSATAAGALLEESKAWGKSEPTHARDLRLLSLAIENKRGDLKTDELEAFLASPWYRAEDFFKPLDTDYQQVLTAQLSVDCQNLVKALAPSSESMGLPLSAYCHWMNREWDKAIKVLDEARTQNPRDALLMLEQAQVMLAMNRFLEGKSLLKLIDKESETSHLLSAQVCLHESDFACVGSNVDFVLAANSKSFLAMELRVRADLGLNQKEKAKEDLQKGLTMAARYRPFLQLREEIL